MIENSKPIEILFSSYGFRSPIVREKIARVIPRDNKLKDKTCLVLPFAGFNVEKTFEVERSGLVEYGFDFERVFNVDALVSGTTIIPDFIYVPGGDPFKLLLETRKRNLRGEIRRWVLDCKTTYIGVSAGANISAQNIQYVKQLEDNNVIESDYGALGLVSNAVVCHAEHYSYSQVKACETVSSTPVVTLRDDQVVFLKDGEWKYVNE